MSTEYDPIKLTKRVIFGTENPSPDDYNKHIRPYGDVPEPVRFNMLNYMTDGGGRYAYPSLFGAVEKIFDTVVPDGTYTYIELKEKLFLQRDKMRQIGCADVRRRIVRVSNHD